MVLDVLLKFTVEACYNFEEHKHQTKSPIARLGGLWAATLIRLSNYGELICVNERPSLGNLSHSLESLIWNDHTNWTRSRPAEFILLARSSVPPTFVLSHIVNKRAIKLCVSLSRCTPDYDYRDARTRTPADVSRRSPPTKFRKPHKIRSFLVLTVYNLHHATHFGHFWIFKLLALIEIIPDFHKFKSAKLSYFARTVSLFWALSSPLFCVWNGRVWKTRGAVVSDCVLSSEIPLLQVVFCRPGKLGTE